MKNRFTPDQQENALFAIIGILAVIIILASLYPIFFKL